MITGPTSGNINNSDSYNFTAPYYPFISKWAWSLWPDTGYISGNGYIADIDFYAPGNYFIECDISTPCGVVQTNGQFTAYGNGSNNVTTLAASPNPVNTTILVSNKATTETELNGKATTTVKPFDVKIIDNTGTVMKQATSLDGADIKVDVGQLQPGIYYLQIFSGNKTKKSSIIINH